MNSTRRRRTRFLMKTGAQVEEDASRIRETTNDRHIQNKC